MKKYYPILLAKDGEFKALANLSEKSKIFTIPILELHSQYFHKADRSTNKTKIPSSTKTEKLIDFFH